MEIWLPALEPQSVSLEIERKRFHFFEARDGVVPEGNGNPALAPFDRTFVREWLSKMDTATKPLAEAGWFPWS